MSDLMKSIILSKRLSESEQKILEVQIKILRQGLNDIRQIDLNNLLPSFAKYILYGIKSSNQLESLNQFLLWLENPTIEINISEDIHLMLEDLFLDFQKIRTKDILYKISNQKSLLHENISEIYKSTYQSVIMPNYLLYTNKIEKLDIDFSVYLLPFKYEVLDIRVVVIENNKKNEMHKHAHETFFIILKGKGKIIVDNNEIEVKAGDFAMIPRWSSHQTINLSSEELIFLAIEDYGLTGKSFMGKYDKLSRLKRFNDK